MPSALLASLVFAATALLAACGPSAPSLDDDRLQAARTAATALSERFEEADLTGGPPRIGTPAVAQDLATLYDNDYLATLETLPVTEASRLGDWAGAANNIGVAYLFWGTGINDPAQLPNDAALYAQIEANTVTYRDELAPYFDFALRSTEAIARAAAASEAALAADDANEKARDGIAQVKAGFAQTLDGILGLFETSGLPDDWLVERAKTLASAKATASSFLESAVWMRLTERAGALAASARDPAIAAALNDFAASPAL